ncbi:TetR/AcrR family transcriptional regulator [Corynebacterium riegelii]|uniref:TetR/AcrR family transcriptional regulator n=1 Tax=Corynebacterium riegelii TaxID=156976 RepID=UPI0028893A74|nr:TetR/AcrR family transcriptional regulator [Corynebacterium riegelii]
MLAKTKAVKKGEPLRADARLKRAQIITTAMEHYRTKPASQVTLESIAADAGVGIATLYRHFPSRAALREACAIGFIELLEEYLQKTVQEFDSNPEEKWETFVLTLMDYGVGMLVGALVADLPSTDDCEMESDYEEFFQRLGELLHKAAAHKLIDPDLTPIEFAAELIVVTRPMDEQFTALFPDVRQRLVRHLLTAWRAAGAAQGAAN